MVALGIAVVVRHEHFFAIERHENAIGPRDFLGGQLHLFAGDQKYALEIQFAIIAAAVARVRKVNTVLRINCQVVGRIEALALPAVNNRARLALQRGETHAPTAAMGALAGDQVALAIHH